MLTILGKNVDLDKQLSCTQVGQLLVSYFLIISYQFLALYYLFACNSKTLRYILIIPCRDVNPDK